VDTSDILQQTAESSVIEIEIILILSLLLITGVALLERRFRFPYTVVLVLAGLLLAFASNFINPGAINIDDLISSELILAFFVPPLIFEGALHINWRTFRDNLAFIILMAVFGVVIATFLIGGMIGIIFQGFEAAASNFNLTIFTGLAGIPFTAAIAFGALISATDPVAVIAFFRNLGVDNRLAILVEGESLLNDGTSIVIFNLALALGGTALLHGETGSPGFSIPEAVWEFTEVAVGGVLVGLVVGILTEIVFARIENRLVETTITIPAAFGAYLLAEQIHLSGILSVVAAGIYLGNKIPRETSPSTKIALYNFWEVLSFIVTSLIFLVIGWVIDIQLFFTPQNLLLSAAAVIAILFARILVVYGMSFVGNYFLPFLNRRLRRRKSPDHIPPTYQHVIFWGGLRGAISLALALSLPPNAFGPGIGQQLRLMAFGVVLFTLLVQGTTIERLIKRLGLAQKSESQRERELNLGRYYAALAAQDELDRLHRMGIVPSSLWEAIKDAQQTELYQYDQEVRDMLHRHPGMEMELTLQTRRLLLQAERTALRDAVQREIISEDLQEELVEELDAHIEAIEQIALNTRPTPGLDEAPSQEDTA
jgi:CPA1 family monovalent cation:H+ antiporter